MAFKHYQGTPPAVRAAWRCPSCGAPNTGALEDGCVACGVGKDAKPAAQVIYPEEGGDSNFKQWWDAQPVVELSRLSTYEVAKRAWEAAVHVYWERKATPHSEVAEVPTAGRGWSMELVDPQQGRVIPDPRTHATVVAALAFYLDNTLRYGAVPGQLSAEECSQLIAKLSPEEVASE
jgi:hypothetical protein